MTFSLGGRSLAIAAAAVGLSLVVGAQQAKPTGFIVGGVVDAATNRPIGGATVTLAPIQSLAGDPSPIPMPAGASGSHVLADDRGRFLFRGLAAGTYGLSATAPGYLAGGLGQRSPGGRLQPFVLAANQRAGDLTIRLWKEAVVSGTVTDESGAAVAEVWVWLLRRDATLRPGQLPVTRGANALTARTDDQGAYRIGDIEPGEYVVSVPSRLVQVAATAARTDPAMLQSLRASGAPDIGTATRGIRSGDSLLLTTYDGMWGGSNALAAFGYHTTFHSGATTIAGATTLSLKAGDDRSRVDVRLRLSRTVALSGTLTGPDGPAAHFAVHLMPAFAAGNDLERTFSTLTTTNGAGAFSFQAVQPGPYVLKAWRRPQGLVAGREPPPADTTLWAEVPSLVVVDEMPPVGAPGAGAGPVVTLRPGGILSGRIRFEGAAPPPMPGPLQPPMSVAFEPAWSLAFGNRLGVYISPAYEFATLGLPAGKYFANLPNQFSASLRGWYFESATHEGRDLTVVPVELDGQRVGDITITFSDQRSELAGQVLDRNGKPDGTAAVLVFPADYRAWIQHGLSPMAARAELVTRTGAFAIPMRPGNWLVAAIDEDTLRTWTRPGAIDAIARTATAVTIVRGERKRVELRRGGQ